MGEVLSLNDFTILMLATMANNNEGIASIPADYKQRIENILCSDNGWKEKFSILINLDDYFEDHFSWEKQLGIEIKSFVELLRKNPKYDFLKDSINISFTTEEINNILLKIKDDFNSAMNFFVALLTDYIYSREYQENFNDYSSKSVQYMKKITEDKKY